MGSGEEEGAMSTEVAAQMADSTINALNEEMDGEHRLLSALGNHASKHTNKEKKAAPGSASEHDQTMQAEIDNTNQKVSDPKGPVAHDESMKGFSKQLEKATKIKPHDEVDSDLGRLDSSALDAKAKTIWAKAKALMKSVPKSSLQWNDAAQLYSAIRHHLVRAIKKGAKRDAKNQAKTLAKVTHKQSTPKAPAAPKKQKSAAEMERDAAYAGAERLQNVANRLKENEALVNDAQAVMDAIDSHVSAHQKHKRTKSGVPRVLPDHYKKTAEKSGSRPGLSKADRKRSKDALTDAASELTNPK